MENKNFVNIVISVNVILVFFISYFVGSLFVKGDQFFYRDIYNSLPKMGVLEGFLWYQTRIDSKELGHFFITWLVSPYLDKDIWNSLVNSLLAFFSTKVFLKWGARPFITMALVVFGYYYLVMYLSAERLKYSFLFITMAIYYLDRKTVFFSYAIFAVLTHVQSFIILGVLSLTDLIKKILRVFVLGRIGRLGIIVLLGFLILAYMFSGHIYSKVLFYSQRADGINELVKITMFCILALFYSRKKIETIVVFIFLFFIVYIVGGDRVNMIGYFVFLYYALKVNGGFNLGVVSTSVYFGIGWLTYINNVIYFGVNTPNIA